VGKRAKREAEAIVGAGEADIAQDGGQQESLILSIHAATHNVQYNYQYGLQSNITQ